MLVDNVRAANVPMVKHTQFDYREDGRKQGTDLVGGKSTRNYALICPISPFNDASEAD